MRGKVGRPRRRPDRVTADRGYDHDKYRREPLARYDRRHEIHEAFLALALACCLVCFRRLQTSVNARSAERTNLL